MTGKKQRPVGQCIYCGCLKILTRDHIPPKNLFPSPRPSNLITVPCCYSCNHLSGMDDEYFRMIISTCSGLSAHPSARKLWPAIQRALSKPQKVNLRKFFFEEAPKNTLKIHNEIYLQRSQDFEIDIRRINNVVERIIKGLFFHERGYILFLPYKIFVYSNPFYSHNSSTQNGLMKTPIKTFQTVGDGVFSYGRHFIDNYSNKSLWSLSFFENIQFICAIRSIFDYQIRLPKID